MTQEDIIRMAREAGLISRHECRETASNEMLERFAALVAAAERHRCAQIAFHWDAYHPDTNYGACIARLIEETAP